MRAVLLAILIAFPVCAQTLHGLGFSSKTCIDLDGDGYGTGPLANLVTTAAGSVPAGLQTVVIGAATGLAVGQRVRYDSGANLEFVALTAVSGLTITGNFVAAHAAGVSVSAGTMGDGSLFFPGYATDDPGCLGLDADDRDATVQTTAQGIAKYGSLTAFLAKLGRDWQVLEADSAADVIGGAGQAAAAAALLINPAHIYYLAPALPSFGCSGTLAQCTGLAYPANSCTSINSPCLTISNLVSAGYKNTGLGGDLIIVRDGWNNNALQITLYPGASTRYNGLWSYPGEHAVVTTAIKLGAPNSCGSPTQTNYIWVDGMRLRGTATQFGGAIVGGSCDNSAGQNHDIVITHNNGTESDSGGLAPLTGFNHIDNWTIAYNTFHDDNCPSSCNTPHGIYLGAHQGPSSNTTIRRNLVFRNSWNGLHWNGAAAGFYIDQNVVYDNGVTGLDFEEGLSHSYIRSNLSFNNAKQLVFYNYPGNCPTQASYQSSSPLILCPGNQDYNLIESNTIYATGNANINTAGSNPDAGCPAGVLHCAQPPIQISNATSPLAGDMGNNTFRNNIIVAYGWNNAKPGVAFGDPTANGTCALTCQGWALTSTFDHNLFWQSDGKGGTNVLLMAANKYTCATAGSVTAAFTNCNVGDPQFAAESIANWNVESYFDLHLLPSSPALHTGTTTGIPNYDVGGRAYVESGPASNPSLGALERNLYSQGWTTLSGAGLSPTVAPPNGYPDFTNCLTPSGLNAAPCPPGGYPFQTKYTSELTAWTDGIKREKPGFPKQLVWFGGGHADYIGNEIYAISLNLATPSIARIIGPSTFAAPGLTVLQTWGVSDANPQPALADGTASTRHTPGNLAYNSDTDKMGLFGGAVAGGNGAHTYDTWEFNLGAVAWERYNSGAANTHDVDCSNYGTGYTSCGFAPGRQLDPIGKLNGSFQGSNIYDPLTKTYWVYWGCAGGCSVITQYYPSLHQHVVRAASQPSLSGGAIGGENTRVFIGDRRWIFVTDWYNNILRSWIIDISGVTSQTPTSSPNPGMVAVTTDPSCNGLLQTPGPGLVYLPAQGRILGFPAGTGGDTYYLMDPANWTCTTGSFTGGPTTSPLNQYIIGKMQHFDSLDATLLVNDVGANAPRVLNLNAGDPGPAGAFTALVTLSQSTAVVAAAGGSGSFTVSAGATGLVLSASSGSAWITVTSTNPATGSVSYSVAANSSNSPRGGTIIVAGETFTISQSSTGGAAGPQQLAFAPLANESLGFGPFYIWVTASSGLPVVLTSNTTSFCTVSGHAVTLAKAGTCSITASQAGNAAYAPAVPVTQTFVVSSGGVAQTVGFGPVSTQILGVPPTVLSATTSSGLAVEFSSNTPAVCTMLGSSLMVISTGTCSITASQPGDAAYATAAPITQTFAVIAQAAAVFLDQNGSPGLTFNGSTGFPDAGGFLIGAPGVTQDLKGNTYVVGLDAAGGVHLNSYNFANSTWNGWQYSGGILDTSSGLTAAVDPGGIVWFTGRDIGNRYWINSWNGTSFGGWILVADGVFSGDSIPQLAIPSDGTIYVIGKDTGGRIWSNSYNSTKQTFTGWVDRQAVMIGQPSATAGQDGTVYVAVRSALSNSPVYVTQIPAGNAATANSWLNGGGLVDTDPQITSQGGTVYLLAESGGNTVYLLLFSEASQTYGTWTFANGTLSDATIAAAAGNVFIAGRDSANRIYWYGVTGNSWFFAGGAGVSSTVLAGGK